MLRIAVCIKQIPLVDDVSFDFNSKRIRRDGTCVINAFDLRAIALAMDLKKQIEAEASVVTMGPPQAREAIYEALAMGLDKGVHLQDVAFAGADTLATARTLTQWLKQGRFDLILLGKYSLDAETGQVGPEIAELLGIPQITGVRKMNIDGGVVYAERETDEGFDEVECRVPVLLTCAERLIKPIKVGPNTREKARRKTVSIVNAVDLGLDGVRVGLAGSPTRVGKIHVVERNRSLGKRVDGSNPAQAAAEVVSFISERLGDHGKVQQLPVCSSVRRGKPGREVWIMCETDSRKALSRVTLELATRGSMIANQIDGSLVALVAGKESVRHKFELENYGVDKLIVLDISADAAYSAETLANVIASLIEKSPPWGFFIPATEKGREWAPRVAARLGLGLTGDAVDLTVDEKARLCALKPAFGGNLLAEIYSDTYPQMATVRPGMLSLGEPDAGRNAEVVMVNPQTQEPLCRNKRSHLLTDSTIMPLEEADIVIGVGMGVLDLEGVAIAKDLARTLRASICATRKVADQGWLPRQLQVGLTGKGIGARIYIAAGIHGSPNHTVALRNVDTIIAINKDPMAPIFEWAHMSVVGDCKRVLRALAKAVRGTVRDDSVSTIS